MATIIVIEDEADLRDGLIDTLVLEGFNALGAENGQVGLQLINSAKPDLIICDVLMPVLDGYGVLNALKANPETAHIPLLFLTARVSQEDIQKGLAMGAADYITKPFKPVDLIDKIRRHLGE